MSLPIARQLDFSEIPVIDLSQRSVTGFDITLIEEVADACERVGFFYIENHSVSAAVVAELHQQAKLFFALPIEIKNALLVDYQMRGYLPLNYQSYKGEDRESVSRQEGFWIGHETSLSTDRPLDGPNRWPGQMPALRQAMEAYFVETEILAQSLMQLFAHALQIDVEIITRLFQRPTTRLKLNHYPPQENPVDQYHIGVLPHADSGAFTILWQDDHGGLEIQNKNEEWVGAPPIENTFVVNLGKVMQLWSGGRFPATKHRVINRSKNDRYSIPLFVNPNQAELIRPLVGEGSSEEKEIRYADYQYKHWKKAFPVAHDAG